MHPAEWSPSATAAPAIHRRSASAPTVRGRRRGGIPLPLVVRGWRGSVQGSRSSRRLPTPLPTLTRKGGGIEAQRREVGVDVVAAWVPESAPACGFEAVRNRGGGWRIFAHQKVAHRGVR